MKIAIIYMTKHGTTEEIAELLRSKLATGEIQLFNLKKSQPKNLENYDTIIIGGSIHVGSIQKKLKKFIESSLDILLKKKIALFMICMQKDEKRDEQFENAFPVELREISIANGFMGGEFCFDKMNFLEKAIIKRIAGKSTNVSKIDFEAIEDFVSKLRR